MSEHEKQILVSFGNLIPKLSEEDKERFLTYGENMVDRLKNEAAKQQSGSGRHHQCKAIACRFPV
jgi:hypothetical protein